MKDFERLEPAFRDNEKYRNRSVPILFSVNDHFVPYAAVMLQSVLEHASLENGYDIIYFHSGLTQEHMDMLTAMGMGRPNVSIRFLNVSPLCRSYTLYTGISDARLTDETYYRLLAGEALSEAYDRIVYLDADMITLVDVASLCRIDVSGCYLAAPYDITGISYCHVPGNDRLSYRTKTLGLTDPDRYFIAGLLVLNLTLLRKDYPGQALMKLAASRDWLQHDQDVLNVICNGGKAKLLHPSWNVLVDYGNNRYLPKPLLKQWLESERAPKVIHYGGSQKPWLKKTPWQEYFWRTAARTPFFAEIVKKILANEQHDQPEHFKRIESEIEQIRQRFCMKTPGIQLSKNQLLILLAQAEACRRKIPENPLISVIVPVYNAKQYLRQCLDSIIHQTYRNLEIILVDDGSTDASGAICDRYAEKDGRIHVIHKKNGGVASARNVGLRAAKGDYIGWVDSDDYIACDMYEYLLQGAKKYRAPVTICGFIQDRGWLWAQEREEDQMLTTGSALNLLFHFKIRNYQCDRLWERWVYDGFSFEEGVVYEDTRLTYQLFEKARWIMLLKHNKYYRRVREDSIVNVPSAENKVQACQALMQLNRNIPQRWPELESILLKNYYSRALELRDFILTNPNSDMTQQKTSILEVCNYLRQQRERNLSILGVGRLGKMEYDNLSKGNKWGFRVSAMASRMISFRYSDNKKNKKNWKKLVREKAKALGGKMLPAYRVGLRLEKKLDHQRSPKQQKPENNSELIFWLQNAREGETIEETKRRVYLSMPRWGGDVELLQRGNFYLLRRLKTICTEHNICFWMLGGTLLGAVRHKGFIPWDDDIDVGILRDELERLQEVMPQYPDLRLERYYYSNGPWQTLKLTLMEDAPFWVDIMVYDYAGNGNATADELWSGIQKHREKLKKKLKGIELNGSYLDEIVFDQNDAERIDNAYAVALGCLPPVMSRDYIYRSLDSVSIGWKHIFPVEKIYPCIQLEFEGERFPAPRDSEWVLRQKFGDYLALPDDVGHIHSRFIGDKLADTRGVQDLLAQLEATGGKKENEDGR